MIFKKRKKKQSVNTQFSVFLIVITVTLRIMGLGRTSVFILGFSCHCPLSTYMGLLHLKLFLTFLDP